MYGANSRTSEVRALCDAVLSCARAGVRYRDMAVLVSDMEAYAGPLTRACEQRGIPVFLDARRPVRSHAAAALLVGAVRAVTGGFQPADVLDVAKTGYAGLTDAEEELLENLCAALWRALRGLPGAVSTGGRRPPCRRRRGRSCLRRYCSCARGWRGPTAGEKGARVLRLSGRVDVQGRLEREAEALTAAGRVPQAEEHAQVWRALVELLEQLHAILGEARMGREEFLSVLEEGLVQATLGVIPDTSDALRLSPLSRMGGGSVRALFVLGCSEGAAAEGRRRRRHIERRGAGGARRVRPAAACTARRTARRTSGSCCMRRWRGPAERLYLSYPFTGDAGALAPSQLVQRVRELFPRAAAGSDLSPRRRSARLRGGRAERLTEGLRRRAEDGVTAAGAAGARGAFQRAAAGAFRAAALPRAGRRRGGAAKGARADAVWRAPRR